MGLRMDGWGKEGRVRRRKERVGGKGGGGMTF